jgi:6-phosphogluconolactonase
MAGTFVYVSNADSREILVFELDLANGDLAAVQRIGPELLGQVMPMAVSPDRRFLYAGQRSEPYSVVAFAIDGSDGTLRHLGSAPLPDSSPYLITDRSGRWLLSVSYFGDLVSVSPIGPQGFPQPAHQVIRTEAHPHSIQVDAANRHAFVPSLGGDVLLQWRFDAVTGQLSANTPAAVRVSSGAGPRHFAFHPNNRCLYLLNELDGSLYVFAYDAAAGSVSERQVTTAKPAGFTGPRFGEQGPSTNGGPKAADIHLTPDGRFLYASERTSSTLAAFKVDLATGGLETIGSVATEERPRGFNIDPTGRYLLAVGQASNHLTVYAIDQASGALTARQRYAMGEGPNWVEVVRLP